jgi:hypothetical protein
VFLQFIELPLFLLFNFNRRLELMASSDWINKAKALNISGVLSRRHHHFPFAIDPTEESLLLLALRLDVQGECRSLPNLALHLY